MSGYWVIAIVAIGAMAGVVVVSRRLAYRPRHDLAPLTVEPFAGSMSLADDPNAHRRPADRGTWFPHPDPWPQGWPQADGWTGDDLADLRDAPTDLDWLGGCLPDPGLLSSYVPPRKQLEPPEQLEAELPEQLARTFREQLGQVDQLEPADRLAGILGRLELPHYEPVLDRVIYDPGDCSGAELPHYDDPAESPEPEPYDVLLAAEVANAVRALDTETGLYLADLADRARAYLLELRECL